MKAGLTIALLVSCVVLAVWHINLGSANIDILAMFAGGELSPVSQAILYEIRLPRLIIALTVGAVLGLSGAAMQSLLRNPLADPSLLGVSNFAALGAVVSLYFGWAAAAWWALPLGGMVGALFAVAGVFLLAGHKSNGLTLILAGVAVNALSGSMIALALNFSGNPYAMSEIVYWLLGSFANRSMLDVAVSLPFVLLGGALIFYCKNFLEALSLGEETAQTLGFNVARQRWWLIIGVALSVGAAVSVSGSIGFVGLVIPHLMRPLVSFRAGYSLFASAIAGAAFMVGADIFVQLLGAGQELKLGVVTALIGGPFFLVLIWRLRRDYV